MDTSLKNKLTETAEAAWKKAYAPYSNFRVGAAVLTKSGDIFTGCNVENISYGLTSCAERNAIFSAIAQKGKIEIEAIAITCESDVGAPPCGACRQVIAEFGRQAKVFYKQQGKFIESNLNDLLPSSFDRLSA